MNKFLLLVLGVLFALHASLLAAAPLPPPCMDADCPMSQCIEADCLPGALTGALPAPPVFTVPAACVDGLAPAPGPLPFLMKEVWTPPD